MYKKNPLKKSLRFDFPDLIERSNLNDGLPNNFEKNYLDLATQV